MTKHFFPRDASLFSAVCLMRRVSEGFDDYRFGVSRTIKLTNPATHTTRFLHDDLTLIPYIYGGGTKGTFIDTDPALLPFAANTDLMGDMGQTHADEHGRGDQL